MLLRRVLTSVGVCFSSWCSLRISFIFLMTISIVLPAYILSGALIVSFDRISRTSLIALIRSSEDETVGIASLLVSSLCALGCAVFVPFAPLGFVVSVDSFFFGAIGTLGGVQHFCVGVRAMVLLLLKAESSSSSSSVQSIVVLEVDGSRLDARLRRVVIVVWLGAGFCALFELVFVFG